MKIRIARKIENIFCKATDKRYFDMDGTPKYENKKFNRFVHLFAKAVVRLNKADNPQENVSIFEAKHKRYTDSHNLSWNDIQDALFAGKKCRRAAWRTDEYISNVIQGYILYYFDDFDISGKKQTFFCNFADKPQYETDIEANDWVIL